mmetsp:Transcript_104441/g.302196  ORF Transcript_104441/g.302196 Transcript_104441/m.302196 type:complete len:168 (-) Transcript_104441:688-1191(-)
MGFKSRIFGEWGISLLVVVTDRLGSQFSNHLDPLIELGLNVLGQNTFQSILRDFKMRFEASSEFAIDADTSFGAWFRDQISHIFARLNEFFSIFFVRRSFLVSSNRIRKTHVILGTGQLVLFLVGNSIFRNSSGRVIREKDGNADGHHQDNHDPLEKRRMLLARRWK